jgi:WD40-like Beta Propeller Repeat
MTLDRDLDRRLVAWLDERAVTSPPTDLLARSLARVDSTRQRPGWLNGGNPVRGTIAVGRTLIPAWVVLAVFALVAIAVIAVGARLVLRAVVLGPSPSPALTAEATPALTEPTPSATAVGLLGGGPILAQTYTGLDDPGPFDVVSIDPGTRATTLLGTLPGKSVTGSALPYTFMRNADLTRVVLDRPLDEPTAAAERFGFTVASDLGRECCPNEGMGWTTLSPIGDRAAAVHSDRFDKPIEIVVVDLTGRVITRIPIPSAMTWGGPLQWAPDGQSLLVSGCRPCNKAETPTQKQTAHHEHLYVVPLDGSPWRELLDIDNGAVTGQWSPDGSRLAVERYACARGSFMPRCDPAETHDSLSVLDLSSDTETTFGDLAFVSEGDWSPDGRRIAFGALDGTYVVGAATGVRTKVASARSFGADWSPDGLWLIAHRELVVGAEIDDTIVRGDGTELFLLSGFAAATW